MLGVALEHGHEGLHAVERLAPAGADDDHRQPVLAHAVEELAQVCDIGHTQQAARVELERAEQVAQHPGQVLAQPRHAAELQRVRHLVQRDPAQELVVGRLERARGVREVGRDEQQPRGLVGLEHRELVLAEHAPGEEARDGAGLDRQHAAGDRAERPGLARDAAPRSGSSTVSSEVRLASIQPGRSTGSAAGTGWAATSPV